MSEKELIDMVDALGVAQEIATNHGKASYGNPDHHKFVKVQLEKISEMLKKQSGVDMDKYYEIEKNHGL